MQSRWMLPATMRPDHDLDILIQRHQESKQTLDGKQPELTTQHHGNIGLADAKQRSGLHLLQAAPFQHGIDFEDQLRLDEMLRRVRQAEILEDIPASNLICFCWTPPVNTGKGRAPCLSIDVHRLRRTVESSTHGLRE